MASVKVTKQQHGGYLSSLTKTRGLETSRVVMDTEVQEMCLYFLYGQWKPLCVTARSGVTPVHQHTYHILPQYMRIVLTLHHL